MLPMYGTTVTADGGFTIHFIDVEQGDATLIVASTGETLLVDGGRSKDRIRDRLERLGIEDLDAIAMTHPDADHIAGLVEALALYRIERVYLNGGETDTKTYENLVSGIEGEGAQVSTVSRGDNNNVIPLGDLNIRVLHPGELTGDSNVDSMVLLVSCGQVEALLMADAEAESEEEMIQAGVLVEVEVLKVGHHGSDTSTTQAFLDLVKPEVGVISAGLENSYGHPHQEVVDRLEASSVEIIVTDTSEADDTVTLETDCQDYGFERTSDATQ
jgi:beta-lactamase superfamily II metal-dependent hydrolase